MKQMHEKLHQDMDNSCKAHGYMLISAKVKPHERPKKEKAKSTAAAFAVTPPGYKGQEFLCATQDLWAHVDKSS